MICTSKMIMNCNYHEHIKIRAALHHLANRHLNLRSWTEVCKGILDKKVHCNFDGVEYSCSLFGVLFFIMDGFLPLMRAFLDQCWIPNMPIFASKAVMQFIPQISILCEGVQVRMPFTKMLSVNITKEKVSVKVHLS